MDGDALGAVNDGATGPRPGAEGRNLILGDVALNVLEGEHLVTRITWSDVVGYEPPKPAGNVEGVKVQTRDGSYDVPIAGFYGPEGKFKDAFNLAMVLRSVLGR